MLRASIHVGASGGLANRRTSGGVVEPVQSSQVVKLRSDLDAGLRQALASSPVAHPVQVIDAIT